MSNEYYDHGSYPANGAHGSSSALRSELELIEDGFDKLPTLASNGRKLVVVNSGGTGMEATTEVNGAGLTRLRASGTGGIGYGDVTGAGGTVAQATSKSTGVTLNKICGQITMDAAALAAGTIVSFVCTNSCAAAGDLVMRNHVSGGTLGAYSIEAVASAGAITFYVRNNTGGSLSEAIVIRFALFKATTS